MVGANVAMADNVHSIVKDIHKHIQDRLRFPGVCSAVRLVLVLTRIIYHAFAGQPNCQYAFSLTFHPLWVLLLSSCEQESLQLW